MTKRPQSFRDNLIRSLRVGAVFTPNARQPEDRLSGYSTKAFFQSWFTKFGSGYFFLFKKNLAATNIQFGELIALVSAFATDPQGRRPGLQFVSHEEFRSTLNGLLESFKKKDRNQANQDFDTVADLYSDLFSRVAVVEPHYGSCTLYLPPGISLDLPLVCGYSGYVFSCGNIVLIRNVNKVSKDLFLARLTAYLKQKAPDEARVPFIVYSHEDFDHVDRKKGLESQFHHGLTDSKIYLDRFYMGGHRLVSILQEIREDEFLNSRLVIPPVGRPWAALVEEGRPRHTIWLLQDHSIGDQPGKMGGDSYYICFDQLYKNENPYQYFDENKPAWIEHTTTPQTLSAAMLNLTRPWWRAGRQRVLDPFMGTGTSLLEATKYSSVDAVGSDRSPLAAIVARDNLDIFCAELSELNAVEEILSSFEREADQSDSRKGQKEPLLEVIRGKQGREVSFEVSDGSVVVRGEKVLSPVLEDLELSQVLEDLDLRGRLRAYLFLRVVRRNEGSSDRGTLEWNRSYRNEIEQLRTELGQLRKLRQDAGVERRGDVLLIQGSFSLGCTLSEQHLRSVRENIRIHTGDFATFEDKEGFDVIFTDPPYGFNTDEEWRGLATTYKKMIPNMIELLHDGGQLVVCLPEQSFIGRRTPFFAHKEIVIPQIRVAAEGLQLEVVNPTVPEPTWLFRAPYYWRSEKALARTILHYRLRKAGQSGEVPKPKAD